MEKRIYEVLNHFLVEVDETKPFGSHGTQTLTYTWEVFIAVNGEEYKGKAVEPKNQKRYIDWMTIPGVERPLEYMIQAIERQIKK
ncbi:hypothetical protein [Terribacillus halophilus]|uniref:hypothetical protein n=1 Tax=Terribacillus halophilus TaxID=361279 RepID=UPI00098519DC|nr:hypothetical protein [Terribacillus halophilus]